MVKDGMIWRVGSRENINIWQDSWLPRGWSFKVITKRGNNILTRVSELINPVTGHWDDELVDDIFEVEDAELIKLIPLHGQFDDFPAWQKDPKGMFSVRSAYKNLREKVLLNAGGGQGSSSHQLSGNYQRGDKLWLNVWKLPVPSKIRMFI